MDQQGLVQPRRGLTLACWRPSQLSEGVPAASRVVALVDHQQTSDCVDALLTLSAARQTGLETVPSDRRILGFYSSPRSEDGPGDESGKVLDQSVSLQEGQQGQSNERIERTLSRPTVVERTLRDFVSWGCKMRWAASMADMVVMSNSNRE